MFRSNIDSNILSCVLDLTECLFIQSEKRRRCLRRASNRRVNFAIVSHTSQHMCMRSQSWTRRLEISSRECGYTHESLSIAASVSPRRYCTIVGRYRRRRVVGLCSISSLYFPSFSSFLSSFLIAFFFSRTAPRFTVIITVTEKKKKNFSSSPLPPFSLFLYLRFFCLFASHQLSHFCKRGETHDCLPLVVALKFDLKMSENSSRTCKM